MPSTAAEQYLLELVNDARMDPLGDAARYVSSYAPLASPQSNIDRALGYFGVSGTALLAAYKALTPMQPLAFSDVLAGGARQHDQAMIAADQQSHQLPGEPPLGSRLNAEGYAFRSAGENIYAYAEDMLYAHAGFMVDWGGSASTGGMQSPPGHRNNIMGASYRELGVGVVADSDPATRVGPQLVTEDFGTRGTSGTFLLGVAYADADRDGFYSIGEGRAGLAVAVGDGAATSGDSGGWMLATSLTGMQTVRLSGAGLTGTVGVRMALTDASGNGLNAKIDVVDGAVLRLSNSATVTGPVTAVRAIGLQPVTLALGDGVGRTLVGNAGGDTLLGGSGGDAITGGTGNDIIDGGTGSNRMSGGGGEDTAVFGFASTAATVGRSGSAWVVDGPGTHDVLTGFAHYRFADRAVDSLAVLLGSPDPLFDPAYYLAQNPDVDAAGADPYQHWLAYGWREGRNPDAFFDTRLYLAQNGDVAAAGIDPLQHFEQYGWREGREPSLAFSDAKYLAANPDVAAAGMDPLLHYVQYGRSEGRTAFLPGSTAAADPLVDAAYYDPQRGASLVPSGAAAQQQAAWSYDAEGWRHGLNPDAWFDTHYYLNCNPDVAAAGINPLRHYEQYGWHEGRDPSAGFGTNAYLAHNADVAAAGVDPLLHYVVYGQSEGRPIYPA